ncbi:MAG TPA: uroporphyrinogen decarboxylase family protein [Caldilineaceae bacterium]|nr:uroporphyrinogen decarboxylase family protein [Caldilineaceae bacterium]
MNHRERMLATIRGEPTDQIPWAPRMDLWMIAQRTRGTVPEPFGGRNMAEVADLLDVACHAIGGDMTLPGGRDNRLRGLGIDNHQDYPYRVELRDLPMESTDDGIDLRTRIHTSAGEIFTHLHRSPQMASDGISLPFVKSYAIKTAEDFDAIGEIFEHLMVIPTPESYRAFHQRVGGRGLAVARGPVAASPIHLILHELVAMDKFFYLYHDARDAMHRLAERMTPFFEAALAALVASEAEVVFWGANYDQDLTWPPFFTEEIMPWLQKVGERAHAAGKFLLTHTDGENQALLPLYRQSGFDVAESICPAPMTKLTLAQVRAGLGRDITVFGGIPSVALLDDAMADAVFVAYLDELFGALGKGDHLILGVADNVPPNANLDRLAEIKRRIVAFGPVQP